MSGAAAPGRFSMTSEVEHLRGLRDWLRAELARLGVDRATQAALILAVGELCANSIEHAYEGQGGQPINVSVRGHGDRLVIEVEDFGRAFDPARYVEPDLDTLDLEYLTFAAQPLAPEASTVESSDSAPR